MFLSFFFARILFEWNENIKKSFGRTVSFPQKSFFWLKNSKKFQKIHPFMSFYFFYFLTVKIITRNIKKIGKKLLFFQQIKKKTL